MDRESIKFFEDGVLIADVLGGLGFGPSVTILDVEYNVVSVSTTIVGAIQNRLVHRVDVVKAN